MTNEQTQVLKKFLNCIAVGRAYKYPGTPYHYPITTQDHLDIVKSVNGEHEMV